MADYVNEVLKACIQYGCGSSEPSPEKVILGFAKLLLMDESIIKQSFSEKSYEELEGVRTFLADKKLDLTLIRSGLSLLLNNIRLNDKQKKKYNSFKQFIQKDVTPQDVVKKALEASVIPFVKIFKSGNSIEQISEFNKQMRSMAEEFDQNDTPEEKPAEATTYPQTMVAAEESDDENTGTKEPEADNESEPAEPKTIETLSSKYRELSRKLLSVVKGQDQAVSKFVEGCFQGKLFNTVDRDQPRAYFFFFGPSGTGKTLLAEEAAKALQLPWEKYDMSNYADRNSVDELIGTSKIYSNAKDGKLVSFVSKNPECVLIFDEIEKADISVIRLFLQILGSGTIKSKFNDKDISFRDAIIIFTSNVGKELYEDKSANLSMLPEKVLIDAIKRETDSYGYQVLPNEICARIAAGNTIMFNHISIRYLVELVNENFEAVAQNMEQEYGCKVTYSQSLPLLFIFNRGDEIDARIASRQSDGFIKNEIYELTRQLDNRDNTDSPIKSLHFDIDWDGVSSEIQRLFVNESRADVLILADEKVVSLFDINKDKYKIYHAQSLSRARELMKKDPAAVFIDPFYGKCGKNDSILSIADYNTEGVEFFHELTEMNSGLPIYLIDVDPPFSDTDRRTFLQEGAADTLQLDWEHPERFARQFEQLMKELYMESESRIFSQRGWILDFKTKQDVSDPENIKILFYDLKKRMAVDMDSREFLLSEAQRPTVRFKDVIGAEDVKSELKEFIGYLKNPRKYIMEGHRPPKGVLLYGPPGTGKTMLAKAMAGESDVAFIAANASDFANKYVGESEENVRKLFRRAKKYAPSIIFIDEIDAIGKQRTGSDVHTEKILNTLLTEMQGFDSSDSKKPIFVLAATNYGTDKNNTKIGALDEALIRRFDNTFYVPLPTAEERRRYIALMLGKKKANVSEETISNLADRTPQTSLAILQNIIELAFRNAAKEGRKIENNDLLEALENYVYGKKTERSDEYYRSVAIHEVGHAYVSWMSNDKPSYITIESRGDFGGYMQHANSEDVMSYTKDELLARIRISLAGRAAEQVFYGKEKANNTGASSDLQQASSLAFQIICRYGMTEGQLVVLSVDDIMRSSLAEKYISQANELLTEEMNNTIKIIEEGKEAIKCIADELVRENHLTGGQFAELMEKFSK